MSNLSSIPIPVMTATVGGQVPTPPNDAAKFLNGSGAFSVPLYPWIPLSVVTANNSATVDIETTLDATFDQYLITLSNVQLVNNNIALNLRMKQNGSYTATSYAYHNAIHKSDVATYVSNQATGQTEIALTFTSCASDTPINMDVRVPVPTSSVYPRIWAQGTARNAASGAMYSFCSFGTNTGAAYAVTGIRFLAATGNIASGVFRLYGIKNS